MKKSPEVFGRFFIDIKHKKWYNIIKEKHCALEVQYVV